MNREAEHDAMGSWIQTYTGKRFYLDNPVFDINDIAHALSMNCRYNGHVKEFYSVAEHCVIVSLLMQDQKLGDPFEGLMHDAHEAYMTDVPSPWKKHLPDWKKFDEQVEVALRKQFKIGEKTQGCKVADYLALFLEAKQLMRDRGESYYDPLLLRPKAWQLAERDGWRVLTLSPKEAEGAFLKRFAELEGAKRVAA